MKLVELYQQTPVEKHSGIRVSGNKAYFRDTDGNLTEYLILENGELWLVSADQKLKADIAAIKQKVGA